MSFAGHHFVYIQKWYADLKANTTERVMMLSDEEFEEHFLTARAARLERRYNLAATLCSTMLAEQELTARQLVIVLEIRGICWTNQGKTILADADLSRACRIARDRNMVLEHIHALTSLARLRLRQRRSWDAAEHLLPRASQLLSDRSDHESMVLRASIASLYGVIRFRAGRMQKALEYFYRADELLQAHPDPVRELRNLRRLTYVLAWDGQRSRARNYARSVIRIASEITENGDVRSRRMGKYIVVCTWLPVTTHWTLRPAMQRAGL